MSDKNPSGLENTVDSISMSRRKVLLGAAVAAAATAASGSAFAMEHNHDHHAMNEYDAVIDATLDCVKKGQACIEHCIELFKAGDTSVAQCADTAHEMLAMCNAMQQMATFKSQHVGKVAALCRELCLECEKECRKHADHHAACKACAESCKHCAAECKKIAA